MSMNIVPHTTGMKKFLSLTRVEASYRPAILFFGRLWEFDILYMTELDAYKKAEEIADALEQKVRDTITEVQDNCAKVKLSFDEEGRPSVRLPPMPGHEALKKAYLEITRSAKCDGQDPATW